MNSENLQYLSSADLQEKLVRITVGGAQGLVDLDRKALLFATYIQRAFPEVDVIAVQPTDTAAALNSVSGVIRLRLANGTEQEVFGKIHIESNTGKVNPLGAEKEYANAGMLAKAGWPVLQPLAVSTTPDYPLLLYSVIKEPALFDNLEQSHKTGIPHITEEDIKNIAQYNKLIGEKEVQSLRAGTMDEAIDAPVQNLFLKRAEVGGRIDQWYTSETWFQLPGLTQPIAWDELLDTRWEINNVKYTMTFRQIVNQARRLLAFEGEDEAFLCVSHGDDHAGNVRLTNPAVVFDPAFAGWNPASLELKALAHTGFLPMAAMYYSPKGLDCQYRKEAKQIVVETNMMGLPTYQTHEVLARQIIDSRLIPLLAAVKVQGGDVEKEKQRMKSGMAACALLTVNIAKLLEQNDGRAIGLLPMAIMFSELKGLPMLDYLNNKII